LRKDKGEKKGLFKKTQAEGVLSASNRNRLSIDEWESSPLKKKVGQVEND